MKTSEALYKAQLAVLNDPSITFEQTLKILAVLMKEEESAKFSEKLREKQNETV